MFVQFGNHLESLLFAFFLNVCHILLPPNWRDGYRLDVSGRLDWLARYLKDVDANEMTVRFWQEIYDDKGKLVETHEKFPVDKGHQKA